MADEEPVELEIQFFLCVASVRVCLFICLSLFLVSPPSVTGRVPFVLLREGTCERESRVLFSHRQKN